MENCGCRTCIREGDKEKREESERLGEFFIPTEMTYMILCPKCGNKRCPHANDHRNSCTNSNDLGQPGSAY